MISIRDMRRTGASPSEIKRRRQELTKVRHGEYTEGNPDSWALYRLKCAAVLRALKQGAALAGPSAACVQDLHLVGDPPGLVYVRGVMPGRYGKDVRVITGGTAETVRVEGLLVTTAAWTVADCARLFSRRDALIVADSALHLGKCSVTELTAAVSALAGMRGVAKARWVLANADAASESAGETWLRMVLTDWGYQTRSQVVFGDANARVDLLIEGTRVILEFDGLIKYDKSDPEAVKAAIVAERMRQGRLEAQGYTVIRFIWEQLFDLRTTRLRIRTALS